MSNKLLILYFHFAQRVFGIFFEEKMKNVIGGNRVFFFHLIVVFRNFLLSEYFFKIPLIRVPKRQQIF